VDFFNPEDDDQEKFVPLNEVEGTSIIIYAVIIGVIIYQANHTAWLPSIF
jgi:hypothetical protein